MIDILLAAINAKYIHSALGQRCIQANLGSLKDRSDLVEFDIRRRASEIAEQIISRAPRILSFGVYVWNVEIVTEVVQLIRAIAPEIILLLGGPEVSFPDDLPPVADLADYVICGEGEITYRKLCEQLLDGRKPSQKIIPQELPDLSCLELPYSLYREEDIRNRVLYIETSRGCPFGCEFCLSSLDKQVRYFDQEKLFAALEELLERGVTQFKFTDRTFNVNIPYAVKLLRFFHERMRPGLFLHFEMVPHLLPEELKEWLIPFPPGAIQLEMGIQTLNPEVARRISRTLKLEETARSIRWLRENTGVHLHTDLIAGLPGEDLKSFAHGFDTLLGWQPQEIQLGILKRLRGARIARHTQEWGMFYSPRTPYEILKTNHISYPEMCDMKRFARFWDLIANSGRFVQSAPLIWQGQPSAFHAFMECTRYLFTQLHQQSEIALPRLARLLEEFLIDIRRLDPEQVHQTIESDLTHSRSKNSHTHPTHAIRQERRQE
ncbi:MAG: DUF4080 domain-containing protein [Verrucomicrobia bacterium]|nr:DUF4080 domain-containing protein [Verrucomicrobiota bacterium]